MTPELDSVLNSLSDIQREAVNWTENSALVLAGPGSGKTRVLTARIARILEDSRTRNFKLLALTFTTKAATEMRERVEHLVPGLADRTFIGTFHAFCTQMLRQHGSHIGMSPDFAIFDREEDCQAVLRDALISRAKQGEPVAEGDIRWLKIIGQLKARLVVPEKATTQFRSKTEGEIVARIYSIYEDAIRAANATDFNGLILGACRLLRDIPGVAERMRRSYPYWLIDEFQDTSPAQYRLLQLAAGDSFKNLFAVADDDQIIYQWAGASYRQIEKLRADFKPELIQLVQNHRCPPEIVSAANELVANNTFRTPEKKPLIAAKPSSSESIQLRVFETDQEECNETANEIANTEPNFRGRTVVLGRTRSILEPIQRALQSKGVKAVISQRRDRFISPQFAWLHACLDQVLHPSNALMFRVLVDAGNRIVAADLDPEVLRAKAEANGLAFFEQWAREVKVLSNPLAQSLGDFASELAETRSAWRQVVKAAVPLLVGSANISEGVISDADDDKAAWDVCMREILAENGPGADLDQVIQGLALRSKEPPRDPGAVTLSTIHAAKGLEFDVVYVVGLAESVMPSWQSVSKGDASVEMEEERRNCFVAITRTKEKLILSYANSYRNWNKKPSRFLAEMALV